MWTWVEMGDIELTLSKPVLTGVNMGMLGLNLGMLWWTLFILGWTHLHLGGLE